jgi:hypothetical protein
VPQFVDGSRLDFVHPLAAQTHPVRNLLQGESGIETRVFIEIHFTKS